MTRRLAARVRRGARPAFLALLVATLVTSPLAGVVAASDAATPSFADEGYEVAQGETAEVVIDTNGTDTARLTVGDAEERNFEIRATVTDADGDGTVTVRFNTGAAHESGPESYLTVAGDDTVENRTEVAGADDLLDRAPYGLRLGDPDEPTANATLSILSADSDHPDDETPTATAAPGDTHDGTALDTTDGEVRVAAETGQTISGETTLDAGTPISIRVVSESPSSPFLVTAEATVDDDGAFEGAFDFSDMPSGTPITVDVRTDDRSLASGSGEIVDCGADCPTGTATAGGADGETATPAPLDTDVIQVRDTVQADRGAVARIPVTFGDADALTVALGDEDAVEYETSAVVRDANGDGRAVVVVRTGAADEPDRPVLAVAETGETRPANVTSETTLDGALDPFEYDISVSAGTAADGEPDAIGTLVVTADGGADDDSTATADEPPAGPDGATVAADGGSGSALTGLGALAVGGLIAFGGVATFLGFARD